MATSAIYTFLELMRKQGRLEDTAIDKIKAKGHLSNDEAKDLKKVK